MNIFISEKTKERNKFQKKLYMIGFCGKKERERKINREKKANIKFKAIKITHKLIIIFRKVKNG